MTKTIAKTVSKFDTDHLEAMIDRYGLGSVLLTIGAICEDKADHIRESYSDMTLGQAWEDAGDACGTAGCSNAVQIVTP